MKKKKYYNKMDKIFYILVIIFHFMSIIYFVLKNRIDEIALSAEIIVLCFAILGYKYEDKHSSKSKKNEEEI